MSHLSDELVLRLWSRTLLEWRIPVTAPEFSGILARLAKGTDLESLVQRNQILELDDSGYVVEYLLEVRKTPRQGGPVSEVPISDYTLGRDARALLAKNALQNKRQDYIWPGGPASISFWRDVLDGLGSSNMQRWHNATRCLASIMIPLDDSLCGEFYGQLAPRTRSQDISRPLLSWMRRLRRSRSVTVAILLAMLAIISILLTTAKVLTEQFFVLASSLALCFAVVITGMLTWKMIHLDLTRIYGREYNVGQRGEASLLAGATNSFGYTHEMVTLQFGETIYRELVYLCGSDPRVFRCVLNVDSPRTRWGDFALFSTRVVTPDVLRVALAQLRNPALTGAFKSRLVRWLTHVHVVSPEHFEHFEAW
jgi:hypothetical protein